jgi:hypothetical protein
VKDLDEINSFFLDNKNRSGLLQYLANKRGDFKTAFCFKASNGDVCFSKHHTVIKCQETDNFAHLEKASHRQIFNEEVILDFDIKDFNDSSLDILDAVIKCKEELIKFKTAFKVFQTGSTGFHIHIPIYDTDKNSVKRITKLKAYLIQKYKCDALKSSSNVLIALEFAPHWKTGKQKKLLFDTTTEDLIYELSR